MDNVNFERDQINVFKKVEGETEHVGQILEMENFFKFRGYIWEKDVKTPKMPCMESVSKHLKENITNVTEFNITEKNP